MKRGRRGICSVFPEKVRYPTRGRAARVINSTRDKNAGPPLYVYPCGACGGFHLSKQKPRKKAS